MRIEDVFHEERGRILATLIRQLGDFDLVEDAFQDALTTAVEQWPKAGIPGNPVAWLITTARNRARSAPPRCEVRTKQESIARHPRGLGRGRRRLCRKIDSD
jgi:RNA polymerase sigma-70 factor, ECF subfamily